MIYVEIPCKILNTEQIKVWLNGNDGNYRHVEFILVEQENSPVS